MAGWPTAAAIVVPHLAVAIPDQTIPGGLNWSARSVMLRLDMADASQIEILPEGSQRLRVASAPEFSCEARQMRIWLPLRADAAGWPAVLESSFLQIRQERGGGTALVEKIAATATGDAEAGAAGAALAIRFAAQDVELPRGREWPLGRHLQSLNGRAEITGPVPAPGEVEARARSWRDAGGHANLADASVHWGPLELAGHADVKLDASLQLKASGEARASGYARAMDVLAAHHVITDHVALAAKAVLSLLADAPQDGDLPEIVVPFTVSDGTLSLGKVPVVRIPPIVW